MKSVHLISIFAALLVIGWLFQDNRETKGSLQTAVERIERAENTVSFYQGEVKKKDYEIDSLDKHIDSLESSWPDQREIVIRYTPAQKEEYFNKNDLDSTQIILINEERKLLTEVTAAQKLEIQLLKTNLDNKDQIISAQQDIIKAQAVQIAVLKKDIKKLKFQNTLIKIGAGAIVVLALL